MTLRILYVNEVVMRIFLLSVVVLLSAQLADGATCESLTDLKLPNTTITLAQSVAAGAFTPPGGRGGRGGGPQFDAYKDLPAFCRITATLKPSVDSDIKIEVWLPVAVWNMKFEAVGNGGWTGNISYPAPLQACSVDTRQPQPIPVTKVEAVVLL